MCFAQGSYDNSFLIADRSEAWVLETAGSEWVARRFGRGTTAAISNEPTIRTEWDRRSDGLISHAIAHGKTNAQFRLENIHGPRSGHSQQSVGPTGWWAEEEADSFDFALAYVDHGTPLQVSHIRLQRSRQLLQQKESVDVACARAYSPSLPCAS